MEEFKVIVAGCRNFTDYSFIKTKLDIILSEKSKKFKIVIISGTQKGVDTCGEEYATENDYEIIRKKPIWSLGKIAGPLRNEEMSKIADACIVFWDFKSKGSSSMIEIAQKYNLLLRIVKI